MVGGQRAPVPGGADRQRQLKAAARAAGVSSQAAYNRRRLWPAFAEAWDAAKAEGWARIEMLLICAATTTLDPEPEPQAVRDGPEMTVEQALNLYKLHRASQQGGKPQRYGWRRQDADIEDVRAEILRKVEAIERARGRGLLFEDSFVARPAAPSDTLG